MPQEVQPTDIAEMRSVHPSAGGLSLTTTLQTIGFPRGTQAVRLTPRNFSTAVVARCSMNPYLLVYKTTDALATAANLTDYSENAQDNDTSTLVTLSSLNTNASSNALWIGSHLPFRGLSVDVVATNGNASVLSGTYWNGSALTNISLTDNTASGGATFAQDGTITWTVPSDWTAAPLSTIGVAAAAAAAPLGRDGLYWVKLAVSAALDSSTTCASIHALNRSTAYFELTSDDLWEQTVRRGFRGCGSLEALTDAGSANLLVTAMTLGSGVFLA